MAAITQTTQTTQITQRALRVLLVLAVSYAAFWAAGTGAIALASVVAGNARPAGSAQLPGIAHFQQVDERIWRGAAPDSAGYAALAEAGVRTIVDLRPAGDRSRLRSGAEMPGLRVVRIPIHDGRTPTAGDVQRFLDTVRQAQGPVFVHCGAGVGRTGSVVAAYLVWSRGLPARDAMWRSLAVGPPSLEQIAFMSQLEPGAADRPVPPVAVLSRALDAPRLIYGWLR